MPRCVIHKKSIFTCPCTTGSGEEKTSRKRGANTRNKHGEVCGKCRSYIVGGRCSNITCSTRK